MAHTIQQQAARTRYKTCGNSLIMNSTDENPLSSVGRHRYRPEIDGLRAVAVLLVVIYHAGLALPGGFIGVDVFFVISGYLITSIIWGELIQGRFSMMNFWERRCRRILPAALVVCLATVAMGWFQLMPRDFEALGQSAMAQALFCANFFFWQNTGYFDGPAELQPLLHTWSLAVEEQFYFVIPLVLLALSKVSPPRRQQAVMVVLCVIFIGSLLVSIDHVVRHPSAAFYLLHARAWEMMAGSLLALVPAVMDRLPRLLREIGAALGLALIIGSALLLSKETPFPGLAAIPPCLGAVLIVGMNHGSMTWTGKLLAWRPMVFIGLISYSLYLWHWPLFAFAHYWALEPLSLAHRLLLVAAGFVLAVLSWRFVETPFRTRQLCANRPAIFKFSVAGIACLIAVGSLIIWRDGFHSRTAHVAKYADAIFDSAFIRDMTLEDIREERFITLGAKSDDPPTLMVWGDSHAMAAMPAFDEVLKQHGLQGIAATRSSTLPVLGYFYPSKWGLNEQSIPFNEAIVHHAQTRGIKDMVLVAFWPGHGISDADRFKASLLETVNRLATSGIRPWIMLQVPIHSFDVPKALAHAAWKGLPIDNAQRCAKAEDWNGFLEKEAGLLDQIKQAGGRILDPRPAFVRDDGRYAIIKEDVPLYRDNHHLTTRGARLMLVPMFKEHLIPVMTGDKP